jgi:aminoglycoside phosphotransferase (APT) family kinase protein
MGQTPREVLDEMGIRPLHLRRVAHRFVNEHWRVRTSDGVLYLRRSVASRSLVEVSYELRVVDELARKGWPVPRPVGAPVLSGGRVWCAFEALPGGPLRPRTPVSERREQRARGRLLARFHADTDDLAERFGQRPGWHRAEDAFEGLEPLLDGLARTRPEASRTIRRHVEETREALAALDAERRPARLVHGDFSTWNLLHAAGRLSGVLDFDLVHLNHRVADFAISWRGMHDEVVLGYEEVTPLEAADWDLLVPVYRAFFLLQAKTKFVDATMPDPQLGYVLAHLDRQPTLRRSDRRASW